MKGIINFENQSITVNGKTCSFEESGIYCKPKNQEEFLLNDCDNHLRDVQNITEINYNTGNESRKQLTQEEKQIIADGHSLNINQIPDSLEITTKEEWAADYARFWEISFEEAIKDLENGQGYSSVSLPCGGMVAVETNGDHLFFVSDMES